MSFWKVLGGVAAGVGAVVALPVAGPIGAVTLVGAAVGGAVGGAAGAAASAMDEEEKEEVRREAKSQNNAQENIKVAKLVKALEEAEKRLKEDKDYFNLLLALYAVGVGVASCDGKIRPEEIEAIEEFVAGVAHMNLPSHVIQSVENLKESPPNFNTAMEYVDKVDKASWDLFGHVIEIVSRVDGTVCDEEQAFKQAWHYYRAA